MIEPNVYDNERRFIFTNWTNEDFPSSYGGEVKVIKAGESVELPMFKAYLFTKHLVDREMHKAHKESSVSSQEARQPYEDKTIAEVTAGDSLVIQNLKEKIAEEVQAESGEKKKIVPKNVKKGKVVIKEFEDLNEK